MSPFDRLRPLRRAPLAATALVALAALVVTSASAANAAPAPPAPLAGFILEDDRYQTIEAPGANQTLAFGIDDRGRIAGTFEDADGRLHGFVRDRTGEFRTIDVPGAYATVATRTNNRGQVVGDYFATQEQLEQGLKRGFMLDRGTFIPIDVPDAESTEVVGVDDRGRVVGETLDLNTSSARGYLWDDGRFTFITVPVRHSPVLRRSTNVARSPGPTRMLPTDPLAVTCSTVGDTRPSRRPAETSPRSSG